MGMGISVSGPHRVTCAGGGAGTSTGEKDTNLQLLGELVGFYIKYSTTPASTIDTEIDTLGTDDIPSYQLLKLTDNVTSGLFLVRKATVDINGAALLYAAGGTPQTEPIPIMDKLKITLVQGNIADYADVWTFYRPSF